jgi:hypothetical protein
MDTKIVKTLERVPCSSDLKIIDGYAYCSGFSFNVVDIEPVADAHVVKTIETDSIQGIGYKDGTIYLFDSKEGIRILNASPPEESSIGETISPETVTSILFKDEKGIAISEGDSIRFFDFSNPSRPVIKKTITNPSSYAGIQLKGDCAYLGACHADFIYQAFEGIQTFDISNPSRPKLTSNLKLDGGVNVLAIVDNYIYTASEGAGIHILDISDRFTPKYISTFSFPNPITNISYSNGYIYAVSRAKDYDKPDQIIIIDATKPTELSVVKELPVIYDDSQNYRSICISNNYAFLPVKNGIQIIDISSPQDAHTIGFFDLPVADDGKQLSAKNIQAYDNNLFISAEKSDREKSLILVLDPLPIEKISVINTLQIDDYTGGIMILDGFLFIEGEKKMKVFDYTSPTEISEFDSFEVGQRIFSYDISDGIMYVIQTDYGMRIYNLWNE